MKIYITMKTTIKFALAFAAIVLMSSFAKERSFEFIGSYGVSAADPSQIKLTINADHTFSYQDFSTPDQKILVKGNWTSQGRKLILKEEGTTMNFHNVWTFSKNGDAAKSRKGLEFYRLCKIGG
jgi:hypothetical protein